jgi:ribosomal protein S18 acetylase RimI-like enzyme
MSNQPDPSFEIAPMSASEYEAWRTESIASYAEEKTKAGQFPAFRALELAEESFRSLLPLGLSTPNQFLFSAKINGTGASIGSLWLSVKPDPENSAYIFDIVVSPDVRGQGFGRALLQKAEEFARAKGARTIGLNVFGHNHVARSLYESSGYLVGSLNMRKSLESASH